MKKLFFTIVLAFTAKFSFGQSHVNVRGYVKNDGTYVQPHFRTSPNNTVMDNWSTYPNVNPYTGNIGTKIYINDSYYNAPTFNSSDFNRPNVLFQTNDLFKPNPLFN
jgi:hypothetical protein